MEARGGLREDGRQVDWRGKGDWGSGEAILVAVVTAVALSTHDASIGGGRLRRRSRLQRIRTSGWRAVAATTGLNRGRRTGGLCVDAGPSRLPPPPPPSPWSYLGCCVFASPMAAAPRSAADFSRR